MKARLNTHVIGQFVPSQFDEDTIRREFGEQFKEWCSMMQSQWDLEIRTPQTHRNMVVLRGDCDPTIFDWHRDNTIDKEPLTTLIPGRVLLLWSTATPTEIRLRDPSGPEIRVEPFDVVFLDNDECVHRVPPDLDIERWFLRVSFETTS